MSALTITTPATLLDMAEAAGACSPLMWSVAREMHAGGLTWSVRAGEDLVLLAGLYPAGEGLAEAWFNALPAARVHMVALVRAIRLTLRDAGYRDIVTVVRSDAGRRIARAAGFSFVEAKEPGELWSWRKCSVAAAGRTSPKNSSKPSSGARSPSSPGSRAKSIRRRRGRPAAAGNSGADC